MPGGVFSKTSFSCTNYSLYSPILSPLDFSSLTQIFLMSSSNSLPKGEDKMRKCAIDILYFKLPRHELMCNDKAILSNWRSNFLRQCYWLGSYKSWHLLPLWYMLKHRDLRTLQRVFTTPPVIDKAAYLTSGYSISISKWQRQQITFLWTSDKNNL